MTAAPPMPDLLAAIDLHRAPDDPAAGFLLAEWLTGHGIDAQRGPAGCVSFRNPGERAWHAVPTRWWVAVYVTPDHATAGTGPDPQHAADRARQAQP